MQVNSSDRFNAPHLPAWISRPFYRPGFRYPMHRHTFAEVFWIESGSIRHRVGSRDETMVAGDLRFIHPQTAHATAADAAAVLVNLAFPAVYLRELQAFAGEMPFRAGEAPGMHLDADGLTRLGDWTERLCAPGLTRHDVGSFLLWLAAESRRCSADHPERGWLEAALSGLNRPEDLADGVATLARLAGRSPATVGRQIRRRHGCTAIQLVNRRRVAWLARELRMSDAPIPELAARCGLGNLGHCYRLFRAAHGCAPGEYRRRAQSAAG